MTADARRRAEEALATMNGVLLAWGPQPPMSKSAALCHAISVGTVALEALLAAEPAPPAGAEVARLTALLRECNAVCLCGCPDAEHEADECGEGCGHDDHECIRVAKAVLAYVERLRSAAPPPSDAVREAAERLDSLVNRVWSMTPEEAESAGLPTIAKVLRASKRLLSALAASPATVTGPDDAAVREAAEPSEAERLLRIACERLIGVPVAEQSRSLADISLAIDAALLRLRGEGGR